MNPSAIAVRAVTALSDTSTISRLALVVEVRELGHDVGLLLLPSSALVAAVTSSWRIRLSPTRNVPTPTFDKPRDVGGREDAAFADDNPVLRNLGRQVFGRLQGDVEGFQIAIVDADEAAVEASRRDRVQLHHALRRSRPCPSPWRRLARSWAVASSTSARMIRMQSAPQARASAT